MDTSSEGKRVAKTIKEIKSCFSIDMLSEWYQDPINKGIKQAITKRIDVIMTMNIRASTRNKCTPQELQELKWFEQQYNNRAKKNTK